MAVDTARKRASVLSYAFVARTFIVPQNGVPQSDQQTISHQYGGITATAAVSPGAPQIWHLPGGFGRHSLKGKGYSQ